MRRVAERSDYAPIERLLQLETWWPLRKLIAYFVAGTGPFPLQAWVGMKGFRDDVVTLVVEQRAQEIKRDRGLSRKQARLLAMIELQPHLDPASHEQRIKRIKGECRRLGIKVKGYELTSHAPSVER